MGLFKSFTASISGMAAQANQLSTISDNIANANTVGYKEASAQFEDMLNQVSTTQYDAAGVMTIVRNSVLKQGDLSSTTSTTDLGIQGNGFFVVKDNSGATYLTRAGSFVPDSSGNLVNAAGYTLMGYSLASGSSGVTYSANALQAVNVRGAALSATPSTTGTLSVNLDSNAATNSTTPSTTNYTDKTSVVTYDDLGNATALDVYYTKTAANTWEVDIYDGSTQLATQSLAFNPTTGGLTTIPTTMSATLPGASGSTVNFDLSNTTQLAATFAVDTATANGNAPSGVKSVTVAKDGTLAFAYEDGSTAAAYKIPLATVVSANNMTSLAGDVFQTTGKSGEMALNAANSAGLGSINSSQLESSTVDLATQLTDMIVSQRGYEANSKVFETTSSLLQELQQLVK